jgi:hypothetical protein
MADENISDNHIRKPPKHVDSRRRESLTRGFSKRALKGTAHYAVYKVGNRVAEKTAAEEIRNVICPFYSESVL